MASAPHESPRLSSALRLKLRLGERLLPIDQQIAARRLRLLELFSSPSSSSSSSFSWDTFAGRFARSSEAHVCAARAAFTGFLGTIREVLGEGAGEREASIVFTFFASDVPDANGKAAAANLASRLGAATVIAKRAFLSMREAVAFLDSWRRSHAHDDASPSKASAAAGGGGGGASGGSGALVGSGLVFSPLESAAGLSAVRAIFSEHYGALLLKGSAAGEDSEHLQQGRDPALQDQHRRAANSSAAAVASAAAAAAAAAALVPTSSSSSSSSSTRQVDAVWLLGQCAQFVGLTRSELAPESLGSSVLEAMRKHRGNGDALQNALFELLGEAGFEFMLTLMEQRGILVAIAPQDFRRVAAALQVASAAGGSDAGIASRARPALGAGVTVIRAGDRLLEKEQRKANEKMQKARATLSELQHDGIVAGAGGGGSGDALEMLGFSREFLATERALGLQGGEAPPMYGNVALRPKASALSSDSLLSVDEIIAATGAGFGGAAKRALPEGTTEVTNVEIGYREVSVPPQTPPGGRAAFEDLSRNVAVASMDPLAQKAFAGISHLNRLQSELFESAYRSSENLLVCAPTGAGKTNVAMLTVCREIAQHLSGDGRSVQLDEFKIIYVAPMKALAQEVVAKFSQRLQGLGLSVRELTGDMQLTKQEIAATQVIVTTPEKWDVVTRKSGDGSLVALVRLLIIDEVHLLADDRGAVIESIVARTLRLVETSQSVIRIVGLSATLPNYKDVGQFLRVNPNKGLFYFDNAYRPVPLQQTFVGVTERNTQRAVNVMNKIAWDKAIAAIKRGKQVMVFVHSRKDTAKTARALRDLAASDGASRLLSPFGDDASEVDCGGAAGALAHQGTSTATHSTIQGEGRLNLSSQQWSMMQRDVEKSRNAELRELFQSGLGHHHAGMLRPDRALTERMFAAGAIKILVCTATLAWGVNLPAHTVIIKGTQVYNAEHGGFADLGMLDVMQIFGRAGRPQFDTSGEGIIITGSDKLSHYLSLLTAQVPIESSFIKALPDHLNAEVVSGTVTNVREAVLWLSYTYLYVRMMRSPGSYGMKPDERAQDPLLEKKRLELIVQASRRLDECKMMRFDPASGNMAVTDLGRVASHYYVVCESIFTFNEMIEKGGLGAEGKGSVSDENVLALVCNAQEFVQVKVRDDELPELDVLKGEARIRIKGDVSSTVAKVNVLLQAYIANAPLRSFTLISDTAYITQSAGRISRALFEICLKKGWLRMAEQLLKLSKSVDKRLWWTASPLRQFMGLWGLAPEVVKKLEECGTPVEELADMLPMELGSLVRHPKLGPRLSSLVRQVPRLRVETQVQPVTRTVLRLTLSVYADFDWSERVHGASEPWWLWVSDADGERIYHSEYLVLTRKQSASGEPVRLVLTIPVYEPLPTQYWLYCISDRWLGLASEHEISFRSLVLPSRHAAHTPLLNLLPLPLGALRQPELETLYAGGFTHFNPVQSQMFFTVYHTDESVLLGAPTGSGKTVAAELAVFRLFAAHPGQKAVYIAPLKALVSERLRDWQRKFGQRLGRRVVELTGDVTPDARSLREADVIITTPEKWDGITRGWRRRNFAQHVGLVILDEVHLLGEERGPVLEVIVSRMRYIAAKTGRPIRFQGLSTALANAQDLAGWLGVGEAGLFNFSPAVRPIPMEVHVQGFPGNHYCPRMATMNKPAFAAIATYSPDKPVLVFVASRRQTRLTALELIALCATAADNPKRFLRMSDEEVESYSLRIKDEALRHTLAFGVGIHHAGLADSDRAIVEELFCAVKIQVLVCTSTLAWGVNFPAHLVVVKGTEFFDAKLGRYVDFPVTDVLQMMGRAGRPQFDSKGVSVILVHEPKKNFYRKFLYEPFPVESQLRSQLAEHLNAEIAGGSITCRDDAVEYLTWTFFFRRLLQNPAYYDLEVATAQGARDFLYAIVDDVFADLAESGCVELGTAAVDTLAERRHSALPAAPMGGFAPPIAVTDAEASAPLPAPDEAVAHTVLGTVTSYYYLHHTTAAFFSEQVGSAFNTTTASVEAVCRLLCDSPEFAEVPVRHNEDQLNQALSKELPWPTKPSVDFSSPHCKALLLLQARMARAPLPIMDFATDTKSVVDQSMRVLGALIDVAAESGALAAALASMRLAQCIVQARLPAQSEAMQLPHIGTRQAGALAASFGRGGRRSDSAGSGGGPLALAGDNPPVGSVSLQDLFCRQDGDLRMALTSPASGLLPQQAAEAVCVLRALPRLDVRWTAQQSGGEHGAVRGGDGAAVAVVAGGDDLVLRIDVQAPPPGVVGRHAFAPRFRQRPYGWWLVAGCGDELLAIKRFVLQSGQARHELLVPAPEAPGAYEFELRIVSDTVAGVDFVGKFAVSALRPGNPAGNTD